MPRDFPKRRHKIRLSVPIYALVLWLCGVVAPAQAAQPFGSLEDIANASLEDLLHTTVTTASRVPEDLQSVPASIFVVTSEDIRRSGAMSIPDALRNVPGVNVAQRDADKWAVSIRGFNSRTADKILVLIDGRTIYDPLFSGTLWEIRDIVLEDVDRIEVIRGPGGSTWGANAVNGVINIITKHSRETQGGLVTAGGGTEQRGFGVFRYGGTLDEEHTYRVYGKYYNRDNGFLTNEVSDDSYNAQGGFRFDGESSADSSYMIAANGYNGDHDGVTPLDNVHGRGGSVQGRWDFNLSGRSHFSAQAYYDHIDLDASVLAERRNTTEVNLQHEYRATSRLELVSSFQYRYTSDDLGDSELVRIVPPRREDSLVAAALQMRFQLVPDTVHLRLGSKVEHNDYSLFEVEPDAGLSWNINPRHTVWASVARGVRTPSRLENDLQIIQSGTDNIVFRGNRNLAAENLIAYESGYRSLVSKELIFDVTGFYNSYDDLLVADGPTLGNSAHGSTYGVELATTWTASRACQIRAAYSYIRMDLALDPGSASSPDQIRGLEGNTPQNQASVNVRYDLSKNWESDFGLRYVDSLGAPHVSRYVVADARLSHRLSKSLELALIAQNLFDPHHFEQGGAGASEVQQGVYGKLTWTFD